MNMKRIYIFISIIFGMGLVSSCEDFFKQESEDVLYADKEQGQDNSNHTRTQPEW